MFDSADASESVESREGTTWLGPPTSPVMSLLLAVPPLPVDGCAESSVETMFDFDDDRDPNT